MSNILFCGSYVPEIFISKLKHSSQAGNSFQGELINELKKFNNVEIISYLGFPIDQEYLEPLSKQLTQDNITHVIKDASVSRVHAIVEYYKKLKKMLKGKELILLYNYNYLNFLMSYFAKRLGVKTVLIVADHSEVQDYKNPIRKILARKEEKDFNKFDGLIFLSEKLSTHYTKSCSMIVEGGTHFEWFREFSARKKQDSLKILYSGLLNDVTGIDILLEAIQLIPNSEIEFWFTGRGELSENIVAMQKKDPRIKYFGFVSRTEYFRLLNEANIVINPRNMLMPQNQNNFPSKILEYLATGRIIISTRFPGHEKFKKNIVFCESTAKNIAKSMLYCAQNYDELYKTQFKLNREEALEFDWGTQGKKINEFLVSFIHSSI